MTFLNSPFPPTTNAAGFDIEMYNRIVDGITDLTAIMAGITDSAGNISLASAKAIEWGSVSKLTFSAATVQVDRLEVPSPLTWGNLAPGGDAVISNDIANGVGDTLAFTGNLAVAGAIRGASVASNTIVMAQIAEPGDPDDEHSVIWCSNGTGAGDVGDIMLKIQHGSVVKSKTLVDFA